MFEKISENWEAVPEPYKHKPLLKTLSVQDFINKHNKDSINRLQACCNAPTYTENIHLRATKGDRSRGAVKWAQLTEIMPGDFSNDGLGFTNHEFYPSSYFGKQAKDAMTLLRKEIQNYKGRKPSKTYCKRHKCKYISDSGRCPELSHSICEALLQIYIKHPEKSSDLINKIANSNVIYHPKIAKEAMYRDRSQENRMDPSVFFSPDSIQSIIGILCPVISFATAKLASPIEGNRYVYVATVQTVDDITLVLACLLAPFETIKNARQFFKKIKLALDDLLDIVDPIYISGATCGMFEALTEEFGEEACYVGVNNLRPILENMKPEDIRQELIHSIPEYLLTPIELSPHLKKVLDTMALTKEKDVRDKYNLPIGAFRYIIGLRTESYQNLYLKSSSQSTVTHSAELAAEKIANYNYSGSVSTFVSFISSNIRQLIANEWNTCYVGKFSGKFLYDKVSLIPGATERLLHCLMFADDLIWKVRKEGDYLVEWKKTSLVGQIMARFPDKILDLEGTLGCVLPPFGVATVLSELDRARAYNSFLPTPYIVNIKLKVCSCGNFQAFQFPCVHALPIILGQKLAVSDYCDKRYRLIMAYIGFSMFFEKYPQ